MDKIKAIHKAGYSIFSLIINKRVQVRITKDSNTEILIAYEKTFKKCIEKLHKKLKLNQ